MADEATNGPGVVEVGEVVTAVVRAEVPVSGLRDFFDASFGLLPQVVLGQGAAFGGAAFAVYHSVSEESMDLEVGFAVDREVRPEAGVVAGRLPAGRVARLVYAGGFDGLGAAWGELGSWIGAQGLTGGALRWEVYLTQPQPDMDPADLRTELNWLLADS